MQKKKHLAQWLLVTVIIWAVWLPLATSGNIRMDSDRMLYHAQDAFAQYVSEGRSGLVGLLHVFGLTEWNPVLSGVLFLVFFSLSAWILCCFIQRFSPQDSRFPYPLFALIYATAPVWAFHVYFILQIAAVGFGMMLTALLAGLDAQHHTRGKHTIGRRILFEVISTALLGLSLTIYQGLIVYYLSAAAIFLFCHLWHGGKCKLGEVALWALRILAALALYLIAARLIQGGPSGYLTQQIQWGQIPVIQCILNIIIQYGKIVFLIFSGSTSLYPLAVILFVLLMYRRIKNNPNEKKQNIWILLIGAGVMLLPIAMSVLQGSRPVPRTQFALQVAAAFIPAFYLSCTAGKHRGLRMLCILAVCLQIVLNVRLWHTDNVRNQHDVQAAQAISTALADTDAENKPLVFLGSLPFQDDSLLMEKTDVYGRSFFEWIYDPNVPGSATTSSVRLLRALDGKDYIGCDDPALLHQAALQAQSMPAYPSNGFVAETEQYILIKLSD